MKVFQDIKHSELAGKMKLICYFWISTHLNRKNFFSFSFLSEVKEKIRKKPQHFNCVKTWKYKRKRKFLKTFQFTRTLVDKHIFSFDINEQPFSIFLRSKLTGWYTSIILNTNTKPNVMVIFFWRLANKLIKDK